MTPTVRRATAADVDAMAAQLAETFYDDPVISHIFRNERRRDAGVARPTSAPRCGPTTSPSAGATWPSPDGTVPGLGHLGAGRASPC